MGPLVTCGDFNARCRSADDGTSDVPNRKVIDVVRNSQGERFMNFLRSTECVVGGRKGKDAFMCVSGRVCLVVDYRVVGVEDFDMIENFRTTKMCEAVEEMRSDGVSMMVPDHSLLH